MSNESKVVSKSWSIILIHPFFGRPVLTLWWKNHTCYCIVILVIRSECFSLFWAWRIFFREIRADCISNKIWTDHYGCILTSNIIFIVRDLLWSIRTTSYTICQRFYQRSSVYNYFLWLPSYKFHFTWNMIFISFLSSILLEKRNNKKL